MKYTNLHKHIKTYDDSNDKDRIIVVDNTQFPLNGAYAEDNIILEYSNHSIYTMKYNLRTISIYMGLASMILCFAIGAMLYLGCKIQRDIQRKFLSDAEDDEDEALPPAQQHTTQVNEEEVRNLEEIDLKWKFILQKSIPEIEKNVSFIQMKNIDI